MDKQALINEQNRVLKSKDAHAAFLFAYEHQYTGAIDVPSLQEIVLEFGSGSDAYEFAKDITGSDTQALQRVIVDRGTIRDAMLVLEKLNDADFDLIKKAVLRKGGSRDIYGFAVYASLKGYTDMNDIESALIDRGECVDIMSFAKNMPAANIDALQQAIIQRGSGNDAVMFAQNIADADVGALQQVVIDRGRPEDAILFARCIEGADIQALQDMVIRRGNSLTAYFFARDIKGADIGQLMSMVIERDTSDGHDPYLFARNIPFHDIRPICDYLITLKKPEYALLMARDVADYLLDDEFRAFQDIVISMGSGADIIKFATQVEDVDIDILLDALAERGKVDEIIEFINCIEDADVSLAEKALIARHDPHIDTFILQAEGASLSSIFNTVLSSNNCADAIWLASVRLSQSIDRDQLQKVVIEHGTAEDIYDYMKNVPSANIVSLRDRLVEMYNDGHDHGILAKFDADTRSSISAVTAKRNTMKTG